MNNSYPHIAFLDEPSLSFGYNQNTPFAKDGLTWFGPFGEQHARPTSIRVGVVGSPKGIELYKKWVRAINSPIYPEKTDSLHHVMFPGFEAVFGCAWPEKPICTLSIPEKEILDTNRIKDRYQGIYATVSLFEDKIKKYINEQDKHIDLWFVVIPEEVYTYGRPKSSVPKNIVLPSPVIMTKKMANDLDKSPSLFDEENKVADLYKYELNFHNQLKARLLSSKSVVQVVRETTLSPEDFMINDKPTRRLQDKASVAWNLCTTAFFKCSGKPWRLSDVREGVCYVGLVFKRDLTNKDPKNACCGAQMFLDSGDGLVFKGAVGPWYSEESGEFHIPGDNATNIAKMIVEAYTQDHGFPPKELFIHGKTKLSNEEWEGFKAGVPQDTCLVSIRIRDDGRLKLYSSSKKPVLRGMAIITSRNKGFLWTRGYVPRLQTYQGREVPNPLSVEICYGQSDLKQVMEDILGLTKINFNRCDFSDGQPVTLRFADHVGEILTATPLTHELPPLPFKHYI